MSKHFPILAAVALVGVGLTANVMANMVASGNLEGLTDANYAPWTLATTDPGESFGFVNFDLDGPGPGTASNVFFAQAGGPEGGSVYLRQDLTLADNITYDFSVDLAFQTQAGPADGGTVEVRINGDPVTADHVFGTVNDGASTTLTGSYTSELAGTYQLEIEVHRDDAASSQHTNYIDQIVLDVGNNAPSAVDDTVNAVINLPVDIAVLANDSDPDADALTVESVGFPANGVAVLSPDNTTIRYTPDPLFLGADQFIYILSDARGGLSLATVYVTVKPINHPPAAVDDNATAVESTATNVAVLANDSDIDGDLLTVTAVTQGDHGSAAVNPDGTVRFTPNPHYIGTDNFTYTADDGNGQTATATVVVTVASSGLVVAAADDVAATLEDTAVNINVLANDTDQDADPLAVTHLGQPAHGTAAVNPDGTVKYTPAPHFFGMDGFTYTVTDNDGSSQAAVGVTVTHVNHPPTAIDDTAATVEDSLIAIPVLANDSDVDADALTVASVTQPGHGSADIKAGGTIDYTPAAGFHGSDNFTYTIGDGHGGTATGRVTVTVSRVNDPPTVAITQPAEGTAFAAEDNITVQADASDADGTVVQVEFLVNGIVAGSATNAPYIVTFSGLPAGPYTLSARAVDNDTAVQTADNVSITVNEKVKAAPDPSDNATDPGSDNGTDPVITGGGQNVLPTPFGGLCAPLGLTLTAGILTCLYLLTMGTGGSGMGRKTK